MILTSQNLIFLLILLVKNGSRLFRFPFQKTVKLPLTSRIFSILFLGPFLLAWVSLFSNLEHSDLAGHIIFMLFAIKPHKWPWNYGYLKKNKKVTKKKVFPTLVSIYDTYFYGNGSLKIKKIPNFVSNSLIL